MLHRKRVAITLYHAFRRQVRRALRIPARAKPAPVLSQPTDYVVGRHSFILDGLTKHFPPGLDLNGKNVCEVGAGDCLATSAFFLGKGARHVDVVEIDAPVVNDKQRRVLELLKSRGYPIDPGLIQLRSNNQEIHLDHSRVTYHPCYMENFSAPRGVDFLFSCSVMEHVEDLVGFYGAAWKAMNSGGYMLHLVDLGGHESFEDPLPPLDFQTYPDWMYDAMFPKYYRATRRFLNEHVDPVKAAGFAVEAVTPTRKADEKYLDQLWPKLRPEARQRPRNEIEVVEFALLARKP